MIACFSNLTCLTTSAIFNFLLIGFRFSIPVSPAPYSRYFPLIFPGLPLSSFSVRTYVHISRGNCRCCGRWRSLSHGNRKTRHSAMQNVSVEGGKRTLQVPKARAKRREGSSLRLTLRCLLQRLGTGSGKAQCCEGLPNCVCETQHYYVHTHYSHEIGQRTELSSCTILGLGSLFADKS